jgi:hypothetical protein
MTNEPASTRGQPPTTTPLLKPPTSVGDGNEPLGLTRARNHLQEVFQSHEGLSKHQYAMRVAEAKRLIAWWEALGGWK